MELFGRMNRKIQPYLMWTKSKMTSILNNEVYSSEIKIVPIEYLNNNKKARQKGCVESK